MCHTVYSSDHKGSDLYSINAINDNCFQNLYKDKTGEAPSDPSVKLEEASKPLDIYGTIKSVQFKRQERAMSVQMKAELEATVSKAGSETFKPNATSDFVIIPSLGGLHCRILVELAV